MYCKGTISDIMTESKANDNDYDKVFKYAEIVEIREDDPAFQISLGTPIEDLKVIAEKVSLKEIVFLRQFKLLQELENKILNGRIKDKETEKIKLQYYKVYLDAINIFIKLANGVKSPYYDKDIIQALINADIKEID